MAVNDTPLETTPTPSEAEPTRVGDEIDFRIVDIDVIEANPYNPNDMEAEMLEALTQAIRDEGMNQPILVREKRAVPGTYWVIDGENRLKASRMAKLKRLPVVCVGFDDEYDDTRAKTRTLSYNHLRGTDIPIKLARLIVDLQKVYSEKDIRALTGIKEDAQQSMMRLLEVPDINLDDTPVTITTEAQDRPIPVSLLLMPDEHKNYTEAMMKAMTIVGPDVTALVGEEVAHYDKAMKTTMGLAGVKLRNVALAMICHAFTTMTPAQQKEAVDMAKGQILAKMLSDQPEA